MDFAIRKLNMHHASALCINMHTMYKKVHNLMCAKHVLMPCNVTAINCNSLWVQQSAVVGRLLSKDIGKGFLAFVFVCVRICVSLDGICTQAHRQ